ncbi:MAG: hypothetical protein PHW76_06350 [Alphaproteobacteria bacterium]|nr:hypothetical protein [Alphaproteobacteria bacterium]
MIASSSANFELEISHNDFVKALKIATYGIKKKTTQLFEISYEKNELVLSGPVAHATAPAKGVWKGLVRTPPQIMKKMVDVVPSDDPLKIGYREGRLYFGKFSVIATLD